MELGFEKTDVFSIPKVKGFGKKSFAYNGCILWNDLSNSIKEIGGLDNFQITVKEHILDLTA